MTKSGKGLSAASPFPDFARRALNPGYDLRQNLEVVPIHNDIDDRRQILFEGGCDRLRQIARLFHPQPARAEQFGKLVETRIADLHAEIVAAERVALVGFFGAPRKVIEN